MLTDYAEKGSYPVAVDREALNKLGVGFVLADIMSEQDAGHHDPVKLREAVLKMVYGLGA